MVPLSETAEKSRKKNARWANFWVKCGEDKLVTTSRHE